MAISIPIKQKALVLPEAFAQWAIREVDVPRPGPGQILVRIDAAGLNPVDWFVQIFDRFKSQYPVIGGWEAAGTVVQLGEGVTSFAVGDKVFYAAAIWENNTTFREYSVTPEDLVAKAPPNLTIEQAASVPLTLNTAALGLYSGPTADRSGAGLTPPWVEGGRDKYIGQPILIFGGTSSVGQFVIQLAKLSGYSPIITTASVKNTDRLKALGATHVLDRNLDASSLLATIKDITKEPFRLVYDAISSEETQNIGYSLLSSGGTIVVVIKPVITEDKRSSDKRIAWVAANPFLPDRRDMAAEMYKQLTGVFERGELKPNQVDVVPGGLSVIPECLERIHRGETSGKKIVVHPGETP